IAGALDCLALHKGGDNGASSDPAKQQRCKAKFATITGSTPPARRDKNYDPIEPTALHNIDWVPVLTDWDILLGQMSRGDIAQACLVGGDDLNRAPAGCGQCPPTVRRHAGACAWAPRRSPSEPAPPWHFAPGPRPVRPYRARHRCRRSEA